MRSATAPRGATSRYLPNHLESDPAVEGTRLFAFTRLEGFGLTVGAYLEAVRIESMLLHEVALRLLRPSLRQVVVVVFAPEIVRVSADHEALVRE